MLKWGKLASIKVQLSKPATARSHCDVAPDVTIVTVAVKFFGKSVFCGSVSTMLQSAPLLDMVTLPQSLDDFMVFLLLLETLVINRVKSSVEVVVFNSSEPLP